MTRRSSTSELDQPRDVIFGLGDDRIFGQKAGLVYSGGDNDVLKANADIDLCGARAGSTSSEEIPASIVGWEARAAIGARVVKSSWDPPKRRTARPSVHGSHAFAGRTELRFPSFPSAGIYLMRIIQAIAPLRSVARGGTASRRHPRMPMESPATVRPFP